MSGSYTGMTFSGKKTRAIALIALVVMTVLNGVNGIPHKRTLLRLCSKNLSDTLHLVCGGRGYNEPFPYSGEEETHHSEGPGLAEECCHNMCSYEQLEQYCKSKQRESSADVVKESYWIINLPQLPVWPENSEERYKIDVDYFKEALKSKIHGLKGAQKKGVNDRGDEGCNGKSIIESVKKLRDSHCKRRRRWQRRRRLGKIQKKKLTKASKSLEVKLINPSQIPGDKDSLLR